MTSLTYGSRYIDKLWHEATIDFTTSREMLINTRSLITQRLSHVAVSKLCNT